ncbi:MAG TPA: O-antigen ligase family protein [Candidatus Hydrogenedentes bacterium]|nr:O-antigen ligase family protein [Candidatus Hydrogenedentota bacterium]HQH69094.1 O-antigen ligase family protein [Candidatus Hydrogenedentota bacterium]HQM50189.1 O-antigen ligase family protein [Candidatus Hydrogenedentota bacterium]
MTVIAEKPPAFSWNMAAIAGVVALAVLAGMAVLIGGTYALLAELGLIVFALVLRWPVLGLYLTTALLLLSGPSGVIGSIRVAIPITGAKIVGAMTFASWLLNAFVRREHIRVGWESVPLLALFLWSALGVFLSETWRLQWPEWFRLGTLVAFFILSVNLLNTQRRIHVFTMVIVGCGVAMALFAVAQYVIPAFQLKAETAIADVGAGVEGAFVDPESLNGDAAVRVSGRAGHSNWLALIILIIMPLNVYWYDVAKTRKGRAVCVSAVFLEILALILTFTRTGFLVGIVIFAVLGVRRLVRVNPPRLAYVAFAIVLALMALPPAYKERVLDIEKYTQSDSVRHRLQLQDAAWEMMLEEPVWGVGLSGYGLRIVKMDTEVAHIMRWLVEEMHWDPRIIGTHNMYLQLASETGLVGLGLMVLFFGIMVRDLRKAEQFYAKAGDRRVSTLVMSLQVSLLSFLLCALFLHALQQKIWWMMAAIAAVVPLYKAGMAESRAGVTRPALDAPPETV